MLDGWHFRALKWCQMIGRGFKPGTGQFHQSAREASSVDLKY